MVWAIWGLPKCRKFTCCGHTFQGNWLLLILMMVSTQRDVKGEVKSFFLFHHWVRIRQTKTSFNRQFSPKRPEVGQIFILRSNFDQNKDHMTSKQVRGPYKNWHPASEGTLKTDIQQVRGPSSNNKHSNHRRLKIGGSGKQKNFLSFFCDVLWIPNIAE